MSNNIVIVDYTLGNLFSVKRAFLRIGSEPIISDKKEDITNAQKIVLPGVGAFSKGIQGLKEKGLYDTVKNSAINGKPILGICLGMQMLMTQSEENGIHDGLDLIKGKVKKFDSPKENNSFKIPHYGWSPVSVPNSLDSDRKRFWQHTILEGIENNLHFYFVHSYFVVTDNHIDTIAETKYGYNKFASVIKQGNITGCQFHPEKSGETGLNLIRNFVLQTC